MMRGGGAGGELVESFGIIITIIIIVIIIILTIFCLQWNHSLHPRLTMDLGCHPAPEYW